MDTAIRTDTPSFPLSTADLDSLGFRKNQIERLIELIEKHIAEGRYPGCQIALARHGKLGLYRSFGNAVTAPARRAAQDDTLWLLYSNTKVVTAVALWVLAERGLFGFSDRIADHVPEFKKPAWCVMVCSTVMSPLACFLNSGTWSAMTRGPITSGCAKWCAIFRSSSRRARR